MKLLTVSIDISWLKPNRKEKGKLFASSPVLRSDPINNTFGENRTSISCKTKGIHV